MNAADQAAVELSAYLTLGMHHSTPEGRAAMAAIVERHVSAERAKRQRLKDTVQQVIPLLQRAAGFWAMQVAGPCRQALNLLREAVKS